MISMHLVFLVLIALHALILAVQARGTKPSADFECSDFDRPTRIDIVIKTGSKLFSGTDDTIRLLLRDSRGVVYTTQDLNNRGNDRERHSIDH